MIVAQVDMRKDFHPIRDQSDRQSCLAFASSAAHEYHTNFPDYLSVEYLFYHAVQRTPSQNPEHGLGFPEIIDAVGIDGQPDEAAWPYLVVQPPQGHWAPPTISSTINQRAMKMIAGDFDAVVTALTSGRAVVLGFVISDAFYRPNGHGIVVDRLSDTNRARHAVLAVGWGFAPGGPKYILIRNSWGATWGVGGYAWVSEDYTSIRLKAAAHFI